LDNNNNISYGDELKNGLKKINLDINNKQIDRFLAYMDLLIEYNKKINLTAIVNKSDIILKHFIDSLSILRYIKINDLRVIDIGSGAGFPGIPLKILCPDIKLTLLDALNKRIKFLELVKNKLELNDINCVHARAEEYINNNNNQREAYDICVSRAVASFSVLSEICMPYVKINGFFVAYKGLNVNQEILEAKNYINKLGGRDLDIKKIVLHDINNNIINHNLVFVRKFSHTPLKYPRVFAKILKRPL